MFGKSINQIKRNFIFLLASEAFIRALTLILTILLARLYGTRQFGINALALSAGNLFEIIFNMGLATVFMQKVAGTNDARDKMRENLRVFLPLRIILSFAGFISMVVFATLLRKDTATFFSLVLSGLYFSLFSIETFLSSCFDSRQKMHFTAAAKLLQFTIIFGLGIFLAIKRAPIYTIMWAYIAGVTGAIILTLILISKYFTSISLKTDLKAWKQIISEGWPITLSGTFIFIYNSLDTIIISLLKGEHEVGLYQISYKITGTIFILATLINQAYLPSLIHAIRKNDGSLEKIFGKALKSIFFWSAPITAGGIILGEKIIQYVFGDAYLEGVPAFRVLIVNCVIYFLSSAMTNLLYASRQQKKPIKIFFFGALANTIANLFMIPLYSIIGAALTTVLAELVVLIGQYSIARKIVKIRLLTNIWQTIVAASVMSAVLPFISNNNLFLALIAGTVVYLGIYQLCQIIFNRLNRFSPVADSIFSLRGKRGIDLAETNWPET
jgi:O-antigen/teichoic acid export membrane protein